MGDARLWGPNERRPAATVLSDEDLVDLARDGDEHAIRELIARYRRFARSKTRSYFLVGGDREDVIQEGMIGLYKAIRDYVGDHDSTFRSFAELCITRQILTAIRSATRRKHAPLNSYVSFDRPQWLADQEVGTVGDTVAVEPDADPARILIASDERRALEETCHGLLSRLEAAVLELYVDGRSYREIADHLGRHVKAVDNALQRIKRKLEDHLRDGGADGRL
ncbi:MAG: RNA polymerase sporulation sigma factor SigH [Actinobacteria bacterium]|nr:RNA polymerase sporulation sigma factor SigH [Actinomycetota bacterium]